MGTLINVPMTNFVHAIDIIRKYEGFNEKAYPDPDTGGAPYTLGYGTQYYSDGSPVKQGHCCTKEKALEHLIHDVNCIDEDLNDLGLHIDNAMRAALISFIHSVGWKPFLYSNIIECIEQENWSGVIDEMHRWVFDKNHRAIGSLLERRREEAELFLKFLGFGSRSPGQTLLSAFSNYKGALNQIQAIQNLEARMNPYLLAEFTNKFYLKDKEESEWVQGTFDGLWDFALEY